MDFDSWTEQVTRRLNEHAEYIKELTLINKEMLKKIDKLEEQNRTNKSGVGE